MNRRQLAVRLDETGVEVTREPGDTNPVAVNGTALSPGESTHVGLPATIVLSGGALELVVEEC